MGQVRWFSSHLIENLAFIQLHAGHRPKQTIRVGVARIIENRHHITNLSHLARVHHRDAVGDLGHQCDVVRNEQDGQVEFIAQPLELIKELGLYDHVE